MAIGSSNSATGYSIGGKSLGVQLGQKSGTALFGNNVGADSLFSASLTATSAISIDAQQIAIKGIQDQIDRIQGFRTNLTPAEKAQLAKHQQAIVDFNQIAATRVLTKSEIGERAEAYIESYRILGKEYEDFSSDEFVDEKSGELATLLATKPKGAEAARLERLQNVLETLKSTALGGDGDPSATLMAQITSVNKQVAQMTQPRPISSLSQAELRQHDDLVFEINTHVGFELELTSFKKLQIERLQKTMEVIQKGGGSAGGLFA